MSRRREFSHWLEVEEEDGSIVRYSIYQRGRSIWIQNQHGYDHLMHPSARSIEDEVRIVFHAKVLRPIMPWMEFGSVNE